MAAPNTLIINSRTVIDAAHIVRASQAAFDLNCIVGNTAMYVNSFVTPFVTTSGLQLNGNATITVNATVNGSLTAGSISTSGTLSAGATTFNSTVKLGNITLQNNLVQVGRSTVQDGGINTSYVGVADLQSTGTITSNVLNVTTVNTSGTTIFNGQTYYNVGNYIQYRNPTNGAIWASEGVQSDGLYYFNVNNPNSTFKYTLFRTSTGPHTADPNLTIGVTTRVSGSLSADSNFTSGGSTTVGGNLQVNGNSNVNGSQTVGGQTIMQNFEARNDSRVLNASQPARGVLYFGNGDKYITWDSANWIARGGSFYASNLVSDGSTTVGGNLQVNGSGSVNGNLNVGGYVNPSTITTGAWIRTGAEVRITGYGSGGLLRFGATDSVYQLYDAGRFVINGGNVEVSNDVYANSVIVRGGNLWTHRNSAYGVLYFGNQYNSYLEYNGAGLLSVPHDFKTFGTFIGVNASMSGYCNANTMGMNYLRSTGNIDAAGDMNATGVVNAGRLHSFGNIGANGTIGAPQLEASSAIVSNGTTYFRGGATRWGGDDGLYMVRDGGWLATNANIRTDGGARVQAGADVVALNGSVYSGPQLQVRLYGEPGTGHGYIYSTSTNLYLENTYAYNYFGRSDVTLKDVREDGYMSDTEALSRVTALEPIEFKWKKEVPSCSFKTHFGFAAQQVLEHVPEIVHADTNGILNIAQHELLPLMVSSIRALKAEIAELRAQLPTTVVTTVAVPKTPRRKKV